MAWASKQDGFENIVLRGFGQPPGLAQLVGNGSQPTWNPAGSELAAMLLTPNRTYLTAYRENTTGIAIPPIPLSGSLSGLAWGKASWLGKTEERVRKEAAEITKGQTTVLAKARVIYEWIVDNMRRDPNAKTCGSCNVERLLSERMGKCADVHTVFVALARASGVPARDLWGIRMPKTREGDITKMQHCWAEFYLPGKGWVPVDAADVHKIIHDRKLSPEEAKRLAERAYFFGSLEENRILLGMAHGRLTPPQAGGPLVYFMYPYAEADGRPMGEDINFNFGYTISFKEK